MRGAIWNLKRILADLGLELTRGGYFNSFEEVQRWVPLAAEAMGLTTEPNTNHQGDPGVRIRVEGGSVVIEPLMSVRSDGSHSPREPFEEAYSSSADTAEMMPKLEALFHQVLRRARLLKSGR
ncbi:MAG: hypothetical protein AAF411_04585 [Myxococcota bacterium]